MTATRLFGSRSRPLTTAPASANASRLDLRYQRQSRDYESSSPTGFTCAYRGLRSFPAEATQTLISPTGMAPTERFRPPV